jgi:hypothetical protein
MLLSNEDVERLEKVGYDRQKFARFDKHGFVRLRNRMGFCVFYDAAKHRCRVYKYRPSGCRVYPVVYSERKGIVVDHLCPMRKTVSAGELGRKGKKVVELLRRVDNEATSRKGTRAAP